MSLNSAAFITMWHDVDPPALSDFLAWHTREHMPERVGIPGFRSGYRYWNGSLSRHVCFTLYEGDSVEAFRAPPYLERLNNPTPWTTRVQPAFRNFLRIVCEMLATEGQGTGGAIATWRLTLQPGSQLDAAAIVKDLRAHAPIVAATVARARPDITAYRTAETELRPAGEEAGFDGLVLAEGLDRATLSALQPAITDRLRGIQGVTAINAAAYDLSFRIEKNDLT